MKKFHPPSVRGIFITKGYGGNEIAALRVLVELRNLGVTVVVNTIHEVPRLSEQLLACGFDTSMEHPPSSSRENLVIVAPSFLAAFKYLLLSRPKQNFAYVYTPFWGNEWIKEGVRRALRRLICRLAASPFSPIRIGILAPYDQMLDGWTHRLGLDYVLPNVVEANAYSSRVATASEKTHVYCVGRIEFTQKAQDRILQLFINHIFPELGDLLTLHFVGDGPDSQTLSALVGDDSNVRIHGWQQKPIHLSDNAIIILGSHFEGLPLVALEALLSDIPVIATRNCGLSSILPEECVFDYLNPDTATSALKYVIKNRAKVVASCRKIVSQLHSAERLTVNAKEFIKNL